MAAAPPDHPRRILMTADTVGGVWNYALELTAALAPHDVHVTLAAMGGLPSAAQTQAAAAIPNLDFRPGAFRLEWMPEAWSDVAAAGRWLRNLADDIQPDVIHFNNYAHAALAWDPPTLVVGHSCVYSWFAAVRRTAPPAAEWRRYFDVVQRGLATASAVTAPTRVMLEALRAHYGRFNAVQPIPNAVRRTAAKPSAKQPLILSAGRFWDPGKNLETLAAAAPGLPWPVYAAGSCDGPGSVAARPEGINLLGQLSAPALADWYERAAIFALPARYEPFGLAALEAGLAGCALVLGDIPSLREVWGDAAIFIPPNDAGALHAALQELITAADMRAEYARRARERAARYTPQRMAQGYVALYQSLLFRRQAQRHIETQRAGRPTAGIYS